MALSNLVRHVPTWVVNGVTVTLGLALVQCSIGFAAGPAAAQVAMGTAVCASLADVVTSPDRVARRVLAAVVASTAAALLFFAIRTEAALVVPMAAVVVFGAMLILSWGPKAGTVSFAAILSLVFAMSIPLSDALTPGRLAWGLAGSAGYWIWAVATSRLLQPAWRRFALASAAESLARLLGAIGRQIGHPTQAAWESGILEEEALLADRLQAARDLIFANGTGPDAVREAAILLQLIDLRDLAMASNLERDPSVATPGTALGVELLGQVVEAMSVAMKTIAGHLRTGSAAPADQALHGLLQRLEQTGTPDGVVAKPAIGSLLKNKLALLRSIQDLTDPARKVELPCQRGDLLRYVTPDEWRFAAIAVNLRPGSPVFRHAVRTCVTASAAYAVARFLPVTPHPQWILLTVAAVMQGSLAQTLMRRNARVLGTLAGCGVVVLLTTASSSLFLSACFLVAAGVAHAFFGVRYAVTAGAAAVMAVLQAHLAAPHVGVGTLERFGDTAVGALLGWGATYVLPIWERKQLPLAMDRATAALRAYAAEAMTLRADQNGMPRFSRQQAYDALRTLRAMRLRSLSEPADVQVPTPELTTWLSAAYGLMSHLSNIRLTLVLHAHEHDDEALGAAMAAASGAIDTLLATASTAAGVADPIPVGPDGVLAAVPHLVSRVCRALADASRIAVQSGQIQARLAR